MANTVKLKRSAVPGRIPTTTDLELGEVAINTYMGKMYIKQLQGVDETIVEVGGAILTFGTVPPTNPIPKHGDRWLNSVTGVIAEYIDDGDSKQWVELSNDGIQGFTGSRGYTGSQGVSGYAGSQGLSGYSGSLGYTGSQGVTGYVGSQGVTGYTGSFPMSGQFSAGFASTNSFYILGDTDFTLECTANSFSVILPEADLSPGRIYHIKNTGTGRIKVTSQIGETIDGELYDIVEQWECLSVQSNGSNWLII